MRLSVLFSFQTAVSRARSVFSFTTALRAGLIAIALLLCAALLLDIFIFYRYSYRVVNLNPKPAAQNVKIDRGGLRQALEILDGRAEQFRELYGNGATSR